MVFGIEVFGMMEIGIKVDLVGVFGFQELGTMVYLIQTMSHHTGQMVVGLRVTLKMVFGMMELGTKLKVKSQDLVLTHTTVELQFGIVVTGLMVSFIQD